MDTELAERLMDMQTTMGRIDERTAKTHTAVLNHDIRISKVEKRQSWMLGIGATCAFAVTVVSGFFRSIFGG